MTQPSTPQPPVADKIAEFVRKAIVPGGVTAGGIGAFWSLFIKDDVGQAVASAVIGLGLSYGAAMLKPFHEATRRRADYAGKRIDQITEGVIASATGFEGRYLRCQASDCESLRAEGMAQRDGIFEPLLKDIFVELQIDGSASLPGFERQLERRLERKVAMPLASEGFARQTIWSLLAESKQQKAYRQMAILAWGGYGKTTLLKHVAYRYGIGEVPQGAPKLVPILLVLRKYRKWIVPSTPEDTLPTLPELINQYHIPSLPEKHLLEPVPPNWAENLLRRGKALVMFDGFDEVPKQERPAVARWLNEQMRQYAKSVFVLTSRPKAYKEQDSADRLQLSVPLWVKPFDDGQRRKFVESWYLCQEKLKTRRDTAEVKKVAAEAAHELLEQIESEPDLKDLAKNPLLLNMIATFHRLYPGAALPKRRVDLYGEIFTLQLKARPRDRRLDTVLLKFDPQPVLGKVALSMMQQVVKRVERDVLLREIKTALAEQDEAVDARKFLRDVVQISELIVQQEDEYEFAHLSFQEYLAAAYVAAEPSKREAVLYEHLTEDWWKATILLYAGKTKKPSRLIREAMRQGSNDLAYACLQQTTKRVDDALRAELENLSEQVQDARYADLERYLQNGQWKEADEETYRLMITEVGKEEGQWFDPEDLLNFPCEPLKAINGLWVKHSGGKFGFSVQKEMYLECGGIPDGKYRKDAWEKLCNMNGWDGRTNFDLTAPQGHLPVLSPLFIKREGLIEEWIDRRRDDRTFLLSHPDL
ncbi:MAG: GUN4 domain-containing protein [Cyanobacteria bacterium J06560_6]